MFVDEGWKPPREPSWEPPARKPPLTKAQERAVVWIIGVNVLLLFVAPVGGATVIHAIAALFVRG
ncbi:hypothetical protein FV220_04025 [Methylobacterium sp. WL19]|nr:hypothetical protein FV220_04025 [Methylobacterium sp. WL19]